MKNIFLTLIFVFAIFITVVIFSIVNNSNNTMAEIDMEIDKTNLEIATFAGGCFWCVEADYAKVPGVVSAVSGYTGGKEINPTYKQVSAGKTGHREAVEITFDPNRISYEQLLEFFWQHHNPTDSGGQFADRGAHYRPAIFYHNDAQKITAEKSKATLEKSGKFSTPIVTEILAAEKFYIAEDYHQDYFQKNPTHYKTYRKGSGRDDFLEDFRDKDGKPEKSSKISDKPSNEDLRAKLNAMQFNVTQNEATEPPFNNEFWDNKEAGIYVDIVSGEPLFASTDKYDSGCGWPSFVKPLTDENIVEKSDTKLLAPRIEVRSKTSDSHLGHVFNDGPKEKGGLRYCINSAALRFIPVDQLAAEGYGKYKELFE